MAKDTFLNRKIVLDRQDQHFELPGPAIMAILNLTPDSFYAGSRIAGADMALAQTAGFLKAGAAIIDLGAYSSRPGAEHITEEDELKRLIPVLRCLVDAFPQALFSVDTFRARVAAEAVGAGAHIINDISAGSLDPEMFATVAALRVPYILMHMKGTPQTMQQNPEYDDVTAEVIAYFREKIADLRQAGVKDILIDPGFGFGKTVAHNYALLQHLDQLLPLNLPLLVGLSRKSMITKVLGNTAAEALNGSTVLHTLALLKGASILRVHDVKEAAECVKLVGLSLADFS